MTIKELQDILKSPGQGGDEFWEANGRDIATEYLRLQIMVHKTLTYVWDSKGLQTGFACPYFRELERLIQWQKPKTTSPPPKF